MVVARFTLASVLLLMFLVRSSAFAQGITLAVGQADTAPTVSSSAQTWPGCSNNCLPNNPAYVVLPGSTRRIWTNVCSGPNAWGGGPIVSDRLHIPRKY